MQIEEDITNTLINGQ